MNYLEIVLQGFFDENNREFLDKYFYREYKKAEKEHFEADEFFNGCLKVIEKWERHLQQRVDRRYGELSKMLEAAKDGTLKYDSLEGKSYEQKIQESILYCEEELKDKRPDGIGSQSYDVHLLSLTNGHIAYNMPYSQVLQIKRAILEAYQKTIKKEITDIISTVESPDNVEKTEKKDLLRILKYELSQKTTITDKLNYWVEIQEKFKDTYPSIASSQIIFSIIPTDIFNEHFKPLLNEPEYQYWHLKFYAQQFFERHLLTDPKIILSKSKSEIEFQLNEIIKIECHFDDERNLKTGFDYTDNSNDNLPLAEYFRIKNDYYNTKLPHREYRERISPMCEAVQIYAKHILLKIHLENKLQEIEQPASANPIHESISFVSKQADAMETNIFCEKMPFNIPIEHFRILTEKQNKNNEQFLTQKQFDDFIERAFKGNASIEKQKINFSNREMLKIQYLFYDFFHKTSFHYFGSIQFKEKYVKLLTENFIGWDYKKVFNNFNTEPKKLLKNQ